MKLLNLKAVAIYVMLIIASVNVSAQVLLSNSTGNDNVLIDFSASMPTTVGTNTGTPFAGKGFRSNPNNTTYAGYLNSNAWSVNGSVYGNNVGSPYNLGVHAPANNQGGIYASTYSPNSIADPAMLIQPSGSSPSTFAGTTGGTIDLRLKNNDATLPITSIKVSYDILMHNDQERSSFIKFFYSTTGTNNSDFIEVASAYFETPTESDFDPWHKIDGATPGAPTREFNISFGSNVAVGSNFYVRWQIGDAAGSGSRDEMGLDNIYIKANFSSPCTPPATTASALSFSNVLSNQMDVGFTRGNGTGGVIVVASTSNSLGASPLTGLNYTANNIFGAGDAIGNGYVVFKGNAPTYPTNTALNFSVFGLNSGTTYYYYVFEYNTVSNPCYIASPRTGNQATAGTSGSTSPTGYFKSRANGNWNNVLTWSSSASAGGPWINSSLKPTSAAAGIFIENEVKLTGPETGRNISIESSGIIDLNGTTSNAGYLLSVYGNTTNTLLIKNGGKLIVWGKKPVFPDGGKAEIQAGGMIEAQGNTNGESDDLAQALSDFKFLTNAIFHWKTSIFTFSTANIKYFNDDTEIPIFRISQNVNAGAGTTTNIYGVLDVTGGYTVTWQNSGLKIFRDGISGAGKVVQSSNCGLFTFDGNAVISGTGIIELNNGGINIASRSGSYSLTTLPRITRLGSDKIINGSIFNVQSADGTFYTDNYVLSGTTNFVLQPRGVLGIGSADGITTGATGNIQTTGRSFSDEGYYEYNAPFDQVTGNALPLKVQRFFVGSKLGSPAPKKVYLTNPSIEITPGAAGTSILNIFNNDDEFVTDDKLLFLNCLLNTPLAAGYNLSSGKISGNQNTEITFLGSNTISLPFKNNTSFGKLIFNKTQPSGITTVTFMNNPAFPTIPFTFNIYKGIEFDPANICTVNFHKENIVLKSNQNATAYFGEVSNNTVITNITNLIIERYIPSDAAHGKSWQILSVPLKAGVNNQTINASWQEGAAPLANPNPGYGTIITSKELNATTKGFDIYTQPGSTIKLYNPDKGANGDWVDTVKNTTTEFINRNLPWMFFVRGDRSVTAYNAPSNPTTLRVKGTPYYGYSTDAPPLLDFSARLGKFVSVNNPYASAIDMNKVNFSGMGVKRWYVWDPLLNGNYGLGGYQTISFPNWYATPGGTANFASNTPYPIIESGQGFIVKIPLSGTPQIQFEENDKVTSSRTTAFRPAVEMSTLSATLFTASGIVADGALSVFDSGIVDGDAKKLPQGGENFGILKGNEIQTINFMSMPKVGDTIQYYISNLKTGGYLLKFNATNLTTSNRVFFHDRFSNTKQEISLSGETQFEIGVTTNADSKKSNRFYLTFGKKVKPDYTNLPLPTKVEVFEVEVYPNPVSGKIINVSLKEIPAGRYMVYVRDVNGIIHYSRAADVNGDGKIIQVKLPATVVAGSYNVVVEGAGVRKSGVVVVE
ncbi:MAG: hypothetical protein JSR00_02710 [Bacteroidetes bacterium]|nr:hypothetical protein [Bacteroidota bacterium]